MLSFERHEIILDACRKSGTISINDLLHLTRSSLTTLRRDINHLSEKGVLQKLRGGVSCVGGPEQRGNFSYEHREMLFRGEKEAIGIAAQDFIQNGDILVLSYSTTCIHVAPHRRKQTPHPAHEWNWYPLRVEKQAEYSVAVRPDRPQSGIRAHRRPQPS